MSLTDEIGSLSSAESQGTQALAHVEIAEQTLRRGLQAISLQQEYIQQVQGEASVNSLDYMIRETDEAKHVLETVLEALQQVKATTEGVIDEGRGLKARIAS